METPADPYGVPTAPHPSGTAAPPSPQELAALLPNLEVLEVLGRGGMGVVYKGRQPMLDRLVAIKVLRPERRDDGEFQARFVREARTLARLMHPYIVTVFDFGRAGDLFYLVMEYVEGSSLRQLRKGRTLSDRDVLDYAPQIAEALEHAHEAGVVHRDIKPENVLVDRRGRVRLVDFGLATLFGPDAPGTPDDRRVSGTPGYMAPEQITAPETVDHRADIYSAGVVTYEMLTGELPPADRPPPSSRAGTDRRLDPIVLRALERDRDLRYQEARQLRADLLRVARTPDSTVRLARTIPAPVDQVFALWTNPAEMFDWYAPSDDYTTSVAAFDPRVGGRFQVAMKHAAREIPHVVTGEFSRVDAPRSLSFTWAWISPVPDVQETQVTVEFLPSGDSTELVLTHERFRDEGQRSGHAEGWDGCLGRLARKLAR
jgi:serine/threonine protein kinase